MDPTYGYHAFHGFHFFGGLLMLLIGIVIGKALMRRRLRRMGAAGFAPMAHGGGCCGPRRCRADGAGTPTPAVADPAAAPRHADDPVSPKA